MDIVGKLPAAPGKLTYLLVVTDYFTKWIEAAPYAQIQEKQVVDFVWKHIICRFGLPKEIVCDNGSQFIGTRFRGFCENWGVQLKFSTPEIPNLMDKLNLAQDDHEFFEETPW